MVILRKSRQHGSLAKLDRLAFPAPSFNGYQEAVIKAQPTTESFIISYVNGNESILKSYNSYTVLPGKRLRPFLSDVEEAQTGTKVLVKRAEDGELVGILDPDSV